MSKPTDLANSCTEEVSRYMEKIISGKCIDWADYKRDCGYLAGLRKAIELEQEIINRANEEDDA
jgi:hypothetical protein